MGAEVITDPETGRFLKGTKGGPGRTKGSRNKLGEQFLEDLQSLWAEEGAQVLQEARHDDPVQFCKMVASILPKELFVRVTPTDELSDDELAEVLDLLRALVLDGARDSIAGVVAAGGRAKASAIEKQARIV